MAKQRAAQRTRRCVYVYVQCMSVVRELIWL